MGFSSGYSVCTALLMDSSRMISPIISKLAAILHPKATAAGGAFDRAFNPIIIRSTTDIAHAARVLPRLSIGEVPMAVALHEYKMNK